MFLEKIESPADLKKLSLSELTALGDEMRKALIEKNSACGGHLASNLGVVELTIALHYVFNSPVDKIIFDVSHQTYCHKMLTGRSAAFINPDKYSSISGHTCPDESEHDQFSIGHTSTSISLACGYAKARDALGNSENIVAIIGDASLDGGEAFEALNYAGEIEGGLIVVVNDNDMSIPENHGSLCGKLTELRNNNGEIKDNYFKSLGFNYVFVKNGHDVEAVISALQKVKDIKEKVIVHVCTQKGKGYAPAENDREKWHWAHPFNVETGEFISNVPKENYGAICREFLLDKMKRDKKVMVIAASTPLCIGFNAENRAKAGSQFMDVGIAEQNGITIAAAMAKYGCKPVFATNSTFYQRAYDQIEQEMCINKCPATMIVTHASVFGHSNDTHHGLLDMALLGNIPGLKYLAPTNKQEYLAMLDWSIDQNHEPVAIRVPWTGVTYADYEVDKDYTEIRYKETQKGSKVAILALGGFYSLGIQVASVLEDKTGIKPTLINPRFITGVDEECLEELKKNHSTVVTIEDGIIFGGFGSKIAQYYSESSVRVLNCGFSMDIPNRYVPAELMDSNGLTPEKIADKAIAVLKTL